MIFKLENSEVRIDGKSILKAFIFTHLTIELCRAIYRAEKKYYAELSEEVKRLRKEQKLAKKKKKAESK